jgi:hypothetical protein
LAIPRADGAKVIIRLWGEDDHFGHAMALSASRRRCWRFVWRSDCFGPGLHGLKGDESAFSDGGVGGFDSMGFVGQALGKVVVRFRGGVRGVGFWHRAHSVTLDGLAWFVTGVRGAV